MPEGSTALTALPAGLERDFARAPWTPEQVASLNEFQAAHQWHACLIGDCPGAGGGRAFLVAQADGWHCPACGYDGNKWSLAHEADGTWREWIASPVVINSETVPSLYSPAGVRAEEAAAERRRAAGVPDEMFLHGATAGLDVGFPAEWTPEQVEKFKAEWDRLTGDPKGLRHHVHLLPPGPVITPVTLTAADPEPPAGTHVRDADGERWVRSDEGDYWLRVGRDYGDPESWVKVAGNYGPVTVLEWGEP